MSEKIFCGKCSKKDLIFFSLKLLGVVAQGGIPEKSVAIPILKNNSSRHRGTSYSKKKFTNLKKGKIITDPLLNLSFYPAERVKKMSWQLKLGGRITFSRTDNNAFTFTLREIEIESDCRRILEKMGLKIIEIEN